MMNFYEFLKHEEDPLSAIIAWLGALESAGIHIKRAAIPELINFGKKHDLISKLVSYSYDSPQSLINDISLEGYQIQCSSLLENPQLAGIHIDPERTMEALLKMGRICRGDEKIEIASYLDYLNNEGMDFTHNSLRTMLPEKYRPLLADPFTAMELNVLSKRHITRCQPAEYSKTHQDYPIFRLDGEWHNDPSLERKAKSLNAKYTDTVCESCFDTILEKHKKN
jgi:hypothetical protein